MAVVTGSGTGGVPTAAVGVGQDDPNAVDANTAAEQADAKAANLKHANAQLGKFDANIKDGRAAEAERKAGLAGKGVVSLAKADGIDKGGAQALFQIAGLATSEVPEGEVNPQQALNAFTDISALLGKPQAGTSASAIALANPEWPLTPLPAQSALLGLHNLESLQPAVANEVPLEAPARAVTKGRTAESAPPVKTSADPQIVARVAFVQKLAALTEKTFAAQLAPEVRQQVAQQLGKKALGILQPFAEQMPALKRAISGVFSAMSSQVDGGATEVEIPHPSLTLIESAVGAAFGNADGFAAQVKANSAQIMPILQKLQEGDDSALQQAPPHIQALAKGVVSWNSAKGVGTFPSGKAQTSESAGASTVGTAKSAQSSEAGGAVTGAPPTPPPQAFEPGASSIASLGYSNLDINELIFMVMSEAGNEQTLELQDAMRDMQKNTLAKQAQREKEEAYAKAKSDMKTQIDNTYYSLVALGPANGGILSTVTMQQFEDGMTVSWGDGQPTTDATGSPTGHWTGPTPSWQMPEPMPTAWTTPPATGTSTTEGGVGAAAYGLDTAQYQYLGDYFAALQKADPADYGTMTLDQYLQGLGMISPISSPDDANTNLSIAKGLTKDKLPDGGTAADSTKEIDGILDGSQATGDPTLSADIDKIMANWDPPVATPGTALQRTKAMAELVAMESALYEAIKPPNQKLGEKLAADEALLKTVLSDVQNGGLKAGPGDPKDPAGALQTFLTAHPPSEGLAMWMQNFTSNAGNIAAQLKSAESQTSDPTGSLTGMTGGEFTFTSATFDLNSNTGSVSGSGKWSSDRDSDTGDLGDHDSGGAASANLPSSVSMPGDVAGVLGQIFGDVGGSATLTADEMASLGGAGGGLPPDALPDGGFTPPDPKAKGAADLGSEYGTAFPSTPTATSTQAFIAGLPGNLPVNANGQPYNPGAAPYVGADGKSHVLSADQQTVLNELSSGASPSIALGPTPDQLTQLKNQQNIVDQINSNNMPTELGATLVNQSGSLADFDAASQKASDDLDSLGDMSTNLQMRLQMLQSQYSQIMEALSNIMKAMNQTSQTLVENLKS